MKTLQAAPKCLKNLSAKARALRFADILMFKIYSTANYLSLVFHHSRQGRHKPVFFLDLVFSWYTTWSTNKEQVVFTPDSIQSRSTYEELLHLISSGELAHGTVLSERALAEKLGLSRTPIREALSKLEAQNYIRRSGRTLLVNGVILSDLLEILGVRRVLEAEAARFAALRMSLDEVEKVRVQINQLSNGDDVSPDQHWEADELLHMSIARASGNGLMIRMIQDCRTRTRMFGKDRIPSRFEAGKAEHLAILDAISLRDAPAAAQLMSQHIEHARRAIVQSLSGDLIE